MFLNQRESHSVRLSIGPHSTLNYMGAKIIKTLFPAYRMELWSIEDSLIRMFPQEPAVSGTAVIMTSSCPSMGLSRLRARL